MHRSYNPAYSLFHRIFAFILLALLIAVTASSAITVHATEAEVDDYEVWLTDQNNTAGFTAETPRGTHGGRLLIYNSADLYGDNGPVNDPQIIDMAELFALDGGHNDTEANVVRPHMLTTSPDQRFVALAFVGSGHVAIIDGASKEPKALFRMSPGAGDARQAHAAFWTLDGRAVIVANQNGKLLERINYDPETDSFVHDTAATLDLANCTTPSGNPCQTDTPASALDPGYLGEHNRPDNAPICPILTNRSAYVTLRGGGLFVVDPYATPMAIVAAYGNAYVGRDGCGGVENLRSVYLNGGTGTLETNPSEFSIYHFRDNFPSAPNSLPDNSRRTMPKVFFRDTGPHRDAHGMGKTMGTIRYLWQFDRMANVAEVFRLPSGRHVATIDLTETSASHDPTVDLVSLSPQGDRFYATLRGPKPQTGAHAAHGETPGLGIVTITQDGASGSLSHVLATSFTNPLDDSEESDPHGITVRRR